ncbi:flagellar biosynthetic protein FliO [Candidatus Margulisiibacteriota bacterium]
MLKQQMINIDKEKLSKTGIILFAALAIISMLLWTGTGKSTTYIAVLKLYTGMFVLMGAAFYLIKYFKGNLPKTKSQSLTIDEKVVLEPGVSIYVLKHQKQQWLVGVGNKQIAMLDKLENKNTSFAEVLEQEEELVGK